ncbi:MAG: hypothetical protein AAFV95_14275 [Bacteroidota bacterium]
MTTKGKSSSKTRINSLQHLAISSTQKSQVKGGSIIEEVIEV